jgi:hypothetical protein
MSQNVHRLNRTAGAGAVGYQIDPTLGWMADPRRGCADTDPDLFFSDLKGDKTRAIGICRASCPFLKICDAYADDRGERFGIWGGRDRTLTRPVGTRPERSEPVAEIDAPFDIDAILSSNGFKFRKLTTGDQGAVLRAGIDRGYTWAELARRFMTKMSDLQMIAGLDGPAFDQRVHDHHAADRNDHQIAHLEGVSVATVLESRNRQKLAPVCGPGGIRKRVAA